MDGIINLHKPLGKTSHDMVYFVRRCLHIKKVGHTGTLDPDAEGVLPICIGKATKAADMLTAADKCYTAQMTLGVTTDTQDASGTVLSTCDMLPSNQQIIDAVAAFKGEIMQLPPMYSAIKMNGKKLYELARQGIEVERTPRSITIFDIVILNIENHIVTLDVHCSKGTYIRTLCVDIGEKLGCGAHMSALTRTKSGLFTIENAVSPDAFKEAAELGEADKYIIPVEDCFAQYPVLTLSIEQEKRVLNGVPIYFHGAVGTTYRVHGANGDFICVSQIVEHEDTKQLKMLKSFY